MQTCNDAECANRGMLVVDVNVIRYILTSAVNMAEELQPKQNWQQRLPTVTKELAHKLETLKICSCDGRLYVSEPVLQTELDESHLMESAHPAGRSSSVYTKDEIREVKQAILESLGPPILTSPTEVAELQSLLSSFKTPLDDHDASLVLAASKVAKTGQRTLIISQDADFEEPTQSLRDSSSYKCGSESYRTDQLFLRTYLTFITKVHECCNYSSETYASLFNAWCFTILERIKRASQELSRRLNEDFLTYQRVMQISISHKCK